ncbi:MAG: hypothetical protein EA374_05030 [Acholeplasmatales bacterium]|nr:MAG: hypothetical protein EA374_05030 [Acholeplasmatales bacterium]
MFNRFRTKKPVYTGKHADVPTRITHYHYDAATLKMSNSFKPLPLAKHYIEVVGLNDIDKVSSLKSYIDVDNLMMEDVFNVRQRNKIEWRDGILFGVFHMNKLQNGAIKDDYMSLIMTQDTLVTFHETPPFFKEAVHSLFETDLTLRQATVDYIMYLILDMITDGHLDVYDFLDEQASVVEAVLLESGKVEQETFYHLRKQFLKLKQCVTPTLEQLNRTLNKNTQLFHPDNQPYFDDLQDHLLRLDNHLSQERELMRHLLDLHINNQSNRLNRIMTTLTLFSALFIPLTFLTGFFGMNFVHFDILAYEHALAVFIGACFLVALFMFWLFKRMKWF